MEAGNMKRIYNLSSLSLGILRRQAEIIEETTRDMELLYSLKQDKKLSEAVTLEEMQDRLQYLNTAIEEMGQCIKGVSEFIGKG